MKSIIFLGPSLARDIAEDILPDAIVLPPVEQADIATAVRVYKPEVIGIVDGVFSQNLSVWHKEILFALERGVTVLGASSMGALRAVELEPFGMIGVGEIFEMYRNGTLEDDDEVALAHGTPDANYANLSLPMVNIRATIECAREEGLIDGSACHSILNKIKAEFYPDRTLPRMLQLADENHLTRQYAEVIRYLFTEKYVDVKARDAELMLRTIGTLDCRPSINSSKANSGSFLFEAMYNTDRQVKHRGVLVRLSDIAAHFAVHSPEFAETLTRAMHRFLGLTLAGELGFEPTKEQVGEEARSFRRQKGLQDDEVFRGWLQANDLDEEEFLALMAEEATLRSMRRWGNWRRYYERNTKPILDTLRLQGKYEYWAISAARQREVVDSNFVDPNPVQFSQEELNDLLSEHASVTGWRPWGDIQSWVDEAGFRDVTDLYYELVCAAVARQNAL